MNADTGRLNSGETTRIVTIPAGSISLEGELSVPESPTGIVLFAHGSGSRRHSLGNQFVARALRRAGLGTLLFDLLTPEEESADQSGGHERFNIGLLTQRLVCSTHWLEGEDESRHMRFGFFGSGTGSGAALVAAADLGQSIGAVVSCGGRPDLAGGALRRVKCPTLLTAGERDETVLELNEEAYELLACEKQLDVIRGATHLFEEPGALEEVGRVAADWFNEHIGGYSGNRIRSADWNRARRL